MQSERWRQCSDIFNAALERPAAERAAFVAQNCEGDEALRRNVESLLEAHEEAGEFIESAALEAAPEFLAKDPDALIGQHLGQYRIDAVLGVGGMGVVYLACDERLGRKVGLKLVPPSLVAESGQLERLKREARTASALNHPNIVTIHEIGEVAGTHYIATEFIDGITLRERIAQGPVPPNEALEIATQLASALCVAHEAGIVHRDIKPENIMLRRDGYVKVLDFGIAKFTRATKIAAQLTVTTQAGMILGTTRYMSPEQARGKDLDAQSDIWSLGVVLYEMLTGSAPFDGETPTDVMAAVLMKEPAPLADRAGELPEVLQHVINKALQKDKTARYRDAAELLDDLRDLKHALEMERGVPAARARARQRKVLFAVTGAAAVIVLFLLLLTSRRGQPPPAVAQSGMRDKSIAVLPFADLSPEGDQQYFSDGMAEEILHALAQVKDLKVAGRNSSFSVRSRNEDPRKIAAELGVAHILTGSVRKQGNQVRITAQLSHATDGFQVWSETFQGELSDVFSLQERIARAITDELKVVLAEDQKSRLVRATTKDPEAYNLFLQASAIFTRRDGPRFADAERQLQEALRRDPHFARARARLAELYSIARAYDSPIVADPEEAVVREANLAIQLDPSMAEPHAALGQMYFHERRYVEARAAYERALQLDPTESLTNFWLAALLNTTGYIKASAEMLDRLLIREPMMPNALLWRARAHLQLGEVDQAERLMQRAADAGLTSVGIGFAEVAHARGDKQELTTWLEKGLEIFLHGLPPGSSRLIAAGTTGDEAERGKAVALIEQYLSTQPEVVSGGVPFALLWLKEPEHALAAAQDKPTRNDNMILYTLWTPAGREARRLPSFSTFARRAGLAEFWDKYGPPDLCQRTSSGEYRCD